MKRHSFKEGQVIFRQGERSDAAYLIASGQVEIVQIGNNGHSETIANLGKGQYIGEMGVIDDKPRSATARAKTPVLCMSVNEEEFMDMLLNRPQESIVLLKTLFERLRIMNEKLMEVE